MQLRKRESLEDKEVDKHEYTMKSKEIRELLSQKRYEDALDILETINVDKVKAITDLSIYAEVFLQNQLYEDCKDILLRIRERTNGRRVVYQLIRLAICMKEVDEAEYYYSEYVRIAPNDPERFVLQYRIDQMKEEPIEVLIQSLEGLKEYDYIEKWAYELAKLYHKAGMKEKCIQECNDIILWFGDGDIVEKAKILKEMYVGSTEKIEVIKAETKRKVEEQEQLLKTQDLSYISEQVNQVLLRELELTKKEKESQKEELQKELEEDMIKPEEELEDFGELLVEEQEEEEEFVVLEEIQSIFEPFFSMDNMADQITKGMLHGTKAKSTCHYAILGTDFLGNVAFAKKMAQALWKQEIRKSARMAKISANQFNQIQISSKEERLRECCLFIEAAGSLSKDGIDSLLQLTAELEHEITLFLSDTKKEMEELFIKQPKLRELVSETIELPEKNEDYFLYQGISYFRTHEYEVSDDAVRKLKEMIRNILEWNEDANVVTTFYEKLEDVMKQTEARTMQQLFEVVNNKKYLNSNLNTILAEDFTE